MTATREPGSGLRVLIIGMYYSPEVTGNAPYTAGLAEHLVERGDDVAVITGLPHYPAWRVAHGTPRALLRRETIRGVTVIRAAHYVPATQSAIRRALYEGTFGLTGLVASLRLPRPDAILGVVPSLSGGILARLTGERLRAPYGLLFQDLMGPAARQSGIAGGGRRREGDRRGRGIFTDLSRMLSSWTSPEITPIYRGAGYLAFLPFLQSVYLSVENRIERGRHVNLASHYLLVAEK